MGQRKDGSTFPVEVSSCSSAPGSSARLKLDRLATGQGNPASAHLATADRYYAPFSSVPGPWWARGVPVPAMVLSRRLNSRRLGRASRTLGPTGSPMATRQTCGDRQAFKKAAPNAVTVSWCLRRSSFSSIPASVAELSARCFLISLGSRTGSRLLSSCNRTKLSTITSSVPKSLEHCEDSRG